MVFLRYFSFLHALTQTCTSRSHTLRPALVGGCTCPAEKKQPLEVAVNLQSTEHCLFPISNCCPVAAYLAAGMPRALGCRPSLCLGGRALATWRQRESLAFSPTSGLPQTASAGFLQFNSQMRGVEWFPRRFYKTQLNTWLKLLCIITQGIPVRSWSDLAIVVAFFMVKFSVTQMTSLHLAKVPFIEILQTNF